MVNIFKGKTQERAHTIIKEVEYDQYKKWSLLGYEYGIAFWEAGFHITNETPLWSEIHELHFIDGFKKGYYYMSTINIISNKIMDNIPDCIGVSTDYPPYVNSYDEKRGKLIRINFGIIFKYGKLVEVSTGSIDKKMMFRLVSPTNLDELINYPLSEINNHLVAKRKYLDAFFVQYDSKGLYINEEF